MPDLPRGHNRYARTAPPGAVYIGRGSPWGNPFRIGADGTREEVCDRDEAEILPTLDVRPLIGRHLVCYCAPAPGPSVGVSPVQVHVRKPGGA